VVPPSHLPPAASSLQPAGAQQRRSAGFTLLELLIVITMMIFITTIALVNYFGVMRAAGYATISNNVFSALLMARQRACIDNKPVFFYLLDTTNYVLQESIGTITSIPYPGGAGNLEGNTPPGGGVVFYDQYGSPPVQSNSVIVNMDNPAEPAATVWKAVPNTPFELHVLLTSSAGWNDNGRNNDHYGTELFARQMLPKGFSFQQSPGTKVIFQPDGTVDIINGLKKLVVQEILGNNNTARQVTFTIESSGKITQGQ